MNNLKLYDLTIPQKSATPAPTDTKIDSPAMFLRI